jgi:hypothetical protein
VRRAHEGKKSEFLALVQGGASSFTWLLTSFCYCYQDIPLRALKSMGEGEGRRKVRNIPFATVVTDLGGAHPLWFNKKVDVL